LKQYSKNDYSNKKLSNDYEVKQYVSTHASSRTLHMIRFTLLWMLIGYLGITAWKDWYRSLCGLILLMGLYQHPDMPKSIFDIPGLNPWNLLLLMIVFAWVSNRRKDGCKWDMPSKFKLLLWLYLCVIVVAFFRMIWDFDSIKYYASVTGWPIPSTTGLWNDYLLNTIKWIVPGLLLFDGCRTDAQIKLALAAILGANVILALQVIQYVPFHTLIGDNNLSEETVNRLRRNVGYHRTDLAVMLAGSFWALLSIKQLFPFRKWWFLLYTGGLFIFLLSLALTGGRGGYLAWVGIGMIFCLFRYRKLLFILPIMIAISLPYAPALVNRITEGVSSDEGVNHDALTAGRSLAWPLVINKIKDAPIIGYGRDGMRREGIATTLFIDYGESAPHPHNAYLEILLDSGIIGFSIVASFFWLILQNSLALFCNRHNVRYQLIGGVGVSLIGAQLIGSLTGQTFYPREITVAMWCAIGLVLRMTTDRHSQKGVLK
jgi:O-antigen ligase